MSEKRIHPIAFSSPDSSLILSSESNKRFKFENFEISSNGSSKIETMETMETTPENGTISSDQKQIRYDRQLRLWGDHGQSLLESTRVCLLNASALGTEILKSLVLPGVGAFTIIDGEEISGADVGANFFLDHSSIGQSRAKVACELLTELNPDAKGDYLASSPEQLLLDKGFSTFDQFTVVIGTNLRRKTVSALGEHLFKRGVPFLVCQASGLVGYIRLLVKEHAVIESHPDNPLPNFMLDRPFPELVDFVQSMDLDSMDYKQHSHTPYVVLLFKALEIWRRQTDQSYPRTYKEKVELKKTLQSMRRPDDKDSLEEENFQEAVHSVNAALAETTVPSSVEEILNDDSAINLTTTSSNFWILCNALRRFVEEHRRLPVRGSLPDMISDSERYVALQTVFLRKAEEEADIVHSYAMEISNQLDRTISTGETRLFCKNAAFLRLVRCDFSLGNCFSVGNANFLNELRADEGLNAFWYLVMDICDQFLDEHGRYPCATLDDDSIVEKDMATLVDIARRQFGQLLADEEFSKLQDLIREFSRYAGCELHAIASYLGGVAAQEVIKLVTHQYVPLNNTYVFDGNSGRGSVFAL